MASPPSSGGVGFGVRSRAISARPSRQVIYRLGKQAAASQKLDHLRRQIAALQALGLPRLLERFAAGETIAATDPAVLELHTLATACRGQLAAAAGVSPAKLPSGTLRAFLWAVGWRLEKAGRIKARAGNRDAYTYRAQRVPLPEGVDAQALAEVQMAELRQLVADAEDA